MWSYLTVGNGVIKKIIIKGVKVEPTREENELNKKQTYSILLIT